MEEKKLEENTLFACLGYEPKTENNKRCWLSDECKLYATSLICDGIIIHE